MPPGCPQANAVFWCTLAHVTDMHSVSQQYFSVMLCCAHRNAPQPYIFCRGRRPMVYSGPLRTHYCRRFFLFFSAFPCSSGLFDSTVFCVPCLMDGATECRPSLPQVRRGSRTCRLSCSKGALQWHLAALLRSVHTNHLLLCICILLGPAPSAKQPF